MSKITVAFHKSLTPYTNGIKTITLDTDIAFSILNDCVNLFPDLEKVTKKVRLSNLENIAIVHEDAILTAEQIFFPVKKNSTYYVVPLFKGNVAETIIIGAVLGFLTSTAVALVQGASFGRALLRGLIGGAFGALSAGAFSYFAEPVYGGFAESIITGAKGTFGSFLASGVALAIGGIVQNLLVPISAKKTSESAESGDRINNDAFSSQVNTTNQGQPIPLNYGMPRIGGHYLSADIETVTIPKPTQPIASPPPSSPSPTDPPPPPSDPYNPCLSGYELVRDREGDYCVPLSYTNN